MAKDVQCMGDNTIYVFAYDSTVIHRLKLISLRQLISFRWHRFHRWGLQEQPKKVKIFETNSHAANLHICFADNAIAVVGFSNFDRCCEVVNRWRYLWGLQCVVYTCDMASIETQIGVHKDVRDPGKGIRKPK